MRAIPRPLPRLAAVLLALTAAATAPPPAAAAGPDRAAEASREPRFELEAIRVEPADRELAALVARELPVRVGQTVTASVLVQTRDYLAGSGLFSEVDVYTERGSRPGAIVMVVAATRAPGVRVETGLGYEPLRSWYLNIVGLRVSSPFDRGGLFRAGFHQGLRAGGIYLDLDVPSLLGPGLDLVADGGAYVEQWDVHDGDVPYYQEIKRIRLMAGLRKHVRDDLSVLFWTGLSGTRLDHTLKSDDEEAPAVDPGRLIPRLQHESGFWETRLEVQLDRRDRLRPWQAGHWVGWTLKGATSDAGPAFWGTELDAHVAVPVARTRAAAFRFRTVYAAPGTPYYMRPILGGIRSLRGFAMGGLSGPLGSRAIWQFSGEWRQPLAGDDPRRPRVTGTVFVDVGQRWDADGVGHDLSASVGYGALFRIRWLQTVNVEIAYPLTEDLTGNPVVLHVSLGRSF